MIQKYEHGIRVMDAVYENVELQVNEIKNNFEIKLAEMQENFEKNLRIERQNAEAQRKAHEKAVDALQKNINNINDLKMSLKILSSINICFLKNLMILSLN